MNEADCARLRALLAGRLATRLAEGSNEVAREDVDVSASAKDEDLGPYMAMDQAIASGRNAAYAAEIAGLAAAIHRIDESPEDFGVCVECDQDIPFRRLELLPHVTMCVACQSRHETGSSRRRKVTDYV